MKYLLVLAVLLIAIHIWRRNRREDMRERMQSRPQAPRRPGAIAPPQDMARCAHCGLHLPLSDAIRGSDGVYCSVAHQRAGPARTA